MTKISKTKIHARRKEENAKRKVKNAQRQLSYAQLETQVAELEAKIALLQGEGIGDFAMGIGDFSQGERGKGGISARTGTPGGKTACPGDPKPEARSHPEARSLKSETREALPTPVLAVLTAMGDAVFVRWGEIPGAATIEVQLAYDAEFTKPSADGSTVRACVATGSSKRRSKWPGMVRSFGRDSPRARKPPVAPHAPAKST